MNTKLINPRRILLKLSGEALQWDLQYGIKVEFLNEIAKKIVYITKKKKIQLVIVIWWWNIFRGMAGAAKWLDRASADYMWMLATIMNWIALWDAIETAGNDVRIMSAIEIPRVAESYIRRRALKHLEKWRIIISVAGTWNPYFTTDSSAVLRALELECDYMVKGTKVDGIYDKDPMKFDDAKKYDEISLSESLNKWLRVMDQSALALAKDEKMDIFIWKLEDIDKIWTKDFIWSYVYAD